MLLVQQQLMVVAAVPASAPAPAPAPMFSTGAINTFIFFFHFVFD
jgi:hypothetical protein